MLTEIMTKHADEHTCSICNIVCSNESDFNNHLLSRIHKMLTSARKKKSKIYQCEKCDFICSKKSNFNNHLLTRKHKMLTSAHQLNSSPDRNYSCPCGKTFKHLPSLSRHKRSCDFKNASDSYKQSSNTEVTQNTYVEADIDFKEMFLASMKQNQELQKQITELIPMVGNNNSTTHNNTNNTNNTTNNNTHFNLNFFLNEQCKDAIPLIDFVKSLQYDFDQLEYTGKHGFVEGVSKIIMDAMNQLDITKRPIHCTDVKRETFYVKDDESWKKEGERNRSIKTAIHNIRNRNLACVPEWIRAHPNCKKIDDPNNDLFIEIIGQYMDASETEFNKVIKTIAKSLTIPKSEYGRKECPVIL